MTKVTGWNNSSSVTEEDKREDASDRRNSCSDRTEEMAGIKGSLRTRGAGFNSESLRMLSSG